MVPSERPDGGAPAVTDPLVAVADRLRCPVCTGPVGLIGDRPRVLACAAGHRFDVARQGHVVLVPGGSTLRADTAAMVAARLRVMDSGALDGVRAALVDACAADPDPGLVVDLGAGPGTYVAAVLDALPGHRGVALDLSVPALRAAARAHDRLAAVGADLTRPLPLADGSVAVALAVFAPLPSAAELSRVGGAGARLIVVTPTPLHLAVLRRRLGLLDVPAGKPGRLDERLSERWAPTGRRESVRSVRLTRDQAADVVAMGPNAWHADDRLAGALAGLPEEVEDTVAVTVSTYARRA